jgi:O-antigen/teichoic acid export membrane protein
LGQVGFGEYGIVNSTAGMIGGVAGLGIGQTVVKYTAELKVTDPERAGRILALSSIVTWLSAGIYALVFFVFAPWLAETTLAAPHLATLLQISAITVALGVYNSVQSCSLTGCEAYMAGSYINIISSLMQSMATLFGAWYWGLKGAIIAMAVGMILTVLFTRLIVKKEWKRFNLRLTWNNMWSEWPILVHFSLPTFLIILCIGPATWACNALLANQKNGYEELGIFNAAFQWQTAMQFLPGVICTALVPVMSEKCGVGELNSSLRVMKGMMRALSFLTIPMAIILIVLSPIIMRGYGVSFSSGYLTMILLVLNGSMQAIMSPVAHFLTASGMMWKGLFYNAGSIISMLLASWLLVRWGAEGLAGARLISTVIHSVFVLLLISSIQTKQI